MIPPSFTYMRASSVDEALALSAEHGLQCGYCTPGMVMAIRQLLADNPDPTEAEVRHGLNGNICRCTGYQNIVAAALAAATHLREA